jgi:hypothetical protein
LTRVLLRLSSNRQRQEKKQKEEGDHQNTCDLTTPHVERHRERERERERKKETEKRSLLLSSFSLFASFVLDLHCEKKGERESERDRRHMTKEKKAISAIDVGSIALDRCCRVWADLSLSLFFSLSILCSTTR